MKLEDVREQLWAKGFPFGPGRRKKAIRALVEAPDPAGMQLLADALRDGHPDEKRIIKALLGLEPEEEPDKVAALFEAWRADQPPALGGVLRSLGWPRRCAIDGRTAKGFLALADQDATDDVLSVLVDFARAIPPQDEALNNDIFAAWNRSGSPQLDQVITAQGRQPADPAFEALHALVAGDLARYQSLQDSDGMLLAQAFEMAPEPFRQRIAQAVQASGDMALLDAYRRAQQHSGMEGTQLIDNLKRVGDHDGLFEALRGQRLLDALPLCEYWAGTDGRPSDNRRRQAVDAGVAAYIALGGIEIEPGPDLPDGMVDIFVHWREQAPSDQQLRQNLDAEDPFDKARGLYLGHERGLVDQARLRQAGESDHWPGRLISRMLVPPEAGEAPAEDHVIWVNAVSSDASLLHAPIEVGPDEYTQFSERLEQARGEAASTASGLLEILCAFQGAFGAGRISVDEMDEAPDRAALVTEDAKNVDFD